MTKEEFQFVSSFQDKLIQPFLKKLDQDQPYRYENWEKDSFAVELERIIRSLKVVSTSRHSFKLEYICKGEHIVVSFKKYTVPPKLEHSLWELHNLFILLELQPMFFPYVPYLTEIRHLQSGFYRLLSIVKPEEYPISPMG